MKVIAIQDNGTIVVTKPDTACVIQWSFRNGRWEIFGDSQLTKEVTAFFNKNLLSKEFESATYNELFLVARLYAAENTGAIEEFGQFIASIGN